MKNLYKTLALSFALVLLFGCGGGSESSSAKADLSMADCSGSYCGVSSGTDYQDNGIGIWRYTNTGSSVVSLNISLSNVVGKDITIVFTNENSAAVSFPSSSSSSSGISFGGNEILLDDIDIDTSGFNDMPDHIRYFDKKGMLHKTASDTSQNFLIRVPMFQDWSEGASKVWYIAPETVMQNRTATLKKKLTANDGKYINFWVEDGEFGSGKITQSVLDNISDKFTNVIYNDVVSIAGEPWGEHDYANLIDSNQPINIVFVNFDRNGNGSGLVGYFWALNNMIDSTTAEYKPLYKCSVCSNEALVFFADTEAVYLSANGTNIMLSTAAHEFTHMINFYQRDVKMSMEDAYDTFLEELTAIMMEDVIGSKIAPDFNDVRDNNYRYWLSYPSYNCDFTTWSEGSYCNGKGVYNYHVAGSFGAYMLRHYGIDFYKNLLKQPLPRPLSTNDRQNSIALLNNVIKTKTDNGEGLGRAVQRWGAGIALFPAASSPKNFGYPERTDSSFYLSAFDGNDFKSVRKLPSSQPSTLKGYGHYPLKRTATTNPYQETVKVPKGVSVTVIVK
jgi:hypothetical protein